MLRIEICCVAQRKMNLPNELFRNGRQFVCVLPFSHIASVNMRLYGAHNYKYKWCRATRQAICVSFVFDIADRPYADIETILTIK